MELDPSMFKNAVRLRLSDDPEDELIVGLKLGAMMTVEEKVAMTAFWLVKRRGCPWDQAERRAERLVRTYGS